MVQTAEYLEQELLTLIRQKKDKIQRVIRRYESCHEDIEDIFQCTILEAYKNIAKFNRESKLETWVIGIALNLTRQHIKKEVHRKGSVLSFADTDEFDHEASNHHNPELDMEAKELVRIIEDEIARIPEDIMKTFTLFSVENKSYQEISNLLDVPIGTVRSRIFNAKKFIARGLTRQT